jgi:hypothetical protein
MSAGHGWIDLIGPGASPAFGANEHWSQVLFGGGTMTTAPGDGNADVFRLACPSSGNRVGVRHTRFRAWNVEALCKFRPISVATLGWFFVDVRCSPFISSSGYSGVDPLCRVGTFKQTINNQNVGYVIRDGSARTYGGEVASTGGATSATNWNWLRVRVVGNEWQVRFWPDSVPEPQVWHNTATLPREYGPNRPTGTEMGDNTYVALNLEYGSGAATVDIAHLYVRDLDRMPATLNSEY